MALTASTCRLLEAGAPRLRSTTYFWLVTYAIIDSDTRLPGTTGAGIGAVTIGVEITSCSQRRQAYTSAHASTTYTCREDLEFPPSMLISCSFPAQHEHTCSSSLSRYSMLSTGNDSSFASRAPTIEQCELIRMNLFAGSVETPVLRQTELSSYHLNLVVRRKFASQKGLLKVLRNGCHTYLPYCRTSGYQVLLQLDQLHTAVIIIRLPVTLRNILLCIASPSKGASVPMFSMSVLIL